MFAAPRKIISQSLFIVSLFLPGLAQADITDACFNFLNAQDYARAESEAKQLLQRGNLDRVDERSAQLCLGMAYYYTGHNQNALPAMQRVEALSQTTEELGITYNVLGMIYLNLKDFDRAELYDQRALKATRELGDKTSEASNLNNLALVALRRGDTERALKLFQEALIITPKANRAVRLNNIASIYFDRKEYKQAIKLLRESIDISRNNGDMQKVAIAQINLGPILQATKRYAAAEKEMLAGLNGIRLIGDKGWEATACENLGKLAKDNPKKNAAEARQWFEKAEAIYREIGDDANADKINKLLNEK